MKKSKKKLKIVNKTRFSIFIIVFILICFFIFKFLSSSFSSKETISNISENNTTTTAEETKPDINFSMSVIGDIMCHNSQYVDAYVSSSGTYDFSYVFSDIKDYMVKSRLRALVHHSTKMGSLTWRNSNKCWAC